MRLVGRLQSPGVVAVLDSDGLVTFAAACGGLFPPARGSNQAANSLVQAAMRAERADRVVTRDDAQIWYRSGHTSELLYGQAAWAGGRLFLTMVAYGAPWLTFSPPRDNTAHESHGASEECEHCHQEFVADDGCVLCELTAAPRTRCPGRFGGCPVSHC